MPSLNPHAATGEVFGFIAEWHDPSPQITRKYLIKYFVDAHSVEIVDLKSNRCFLKKSPCPERVNRAAFYVGSKMMLYSRLMTLVDYADPYTRKHLAPVSAVQVGLVSPGAHQSIGKVIAALSASGAQFKSLKLVRLGSGDAAELCSLLQCAPGDAAVWASGATLAMEVILGAAASAAAPPPGLVVVENDALRAFLFGGKNTFLPTATFDSCTCCVIRPHAVADGHAGAIIDTILAQNYEISALSMVALDRAAAREFLEVYNGVVPEYSDMVDEACMGPCIAMELRAENAVSTFRQTAGPWDVDYAKELRPKTIRAMYGKDRVHNAVHCTDLAEDGVLESQWFFEVLA